LYQIQVFVMTSGAMSCHY